MTTAAEPLPPPPPPRHIDIAVPASSRLAQLQAEYGRAKAVYDAAGEQLGKLKAQIKYEVTSTYQGTASFTLHGPGTPLKLYWQRGRETIAAARVRDENPDLWEALAPYRKHNEGTWCLGPAK